MHKIIKSFRIKIVCIIIIVIIIINNNNTPLGQNICILFYFQAFCKFLGL